MRKLNMDDIELVSGNNNELLLFGATDWKRIKKDENGDLYLKRVRVIDKLIIPKKVVDKYKLKEAI